MELSFSLGVQSMLQYVLLKYNCSWINYHLSKPRHNIVSRLAWAPNKKVNVAFVVYVAPPMWRAKVKANLIVQSGFPKNVVHSAWI